MSNEAKATEFTDETYKIHVTGRHVLVTDPMKDYAVDKISKIEKFSTRIIDVVVTMDIQKNEHRVDIVMKAGHLKVKSSAASEDMYKSIDLAVHKLKNQLIKYKKRIQEHTARKLAVTDMQVHILSPEEEQLLEFNDEIESANRREMIERYKPHKIVKKKTRPLKELTYGEAAMKMDLSGDNFLIYRGEEDKKLKVIYRRVDDNYGLIELEN